MIDPVPPVGSEVPTKLASGTRAIPVSGIGPPPTVTKSVARLRFPTKLFPCVVTTAVVPYVPAIRGMPEKPPKESGPITTLLAEAPGAIGAVSVQVEVNVLEELQFQPEGADAMRPTRPVDTSVSATAPVVAPLPTFCTETVNVGHGPTVWVILTAILGAKTVVSAAALFAELVSPAVAMTAEFVNPPETDAPTLTVIVSCEAALAEIIPAFVHVATWPAPVQLQPAPPPDTKLIPAGSVSVTVVIPVVGPPAFVTVSMYVPLLPAVNVSA